MAKLERSQLYQINLGNLTQGTHTFSYVIDNEFFELFQSEIAENVNCKVEVSCERTETMTTCTFIIKGNLELQCDRSLKLFDYPIDINSVIYYKFGNEYNELAEDLITIAEKEPVVDFSQPIYDLIVLEVPNRKLHPDYREGATDEEEEESFFFSTTTSKGNEETEDNKEEEIDPRWSALKRLKK